MEINQRIAQLAERLGRAPLRDIIRLSGGASQETWRLDLSDGVYILRRNLAHKKSDATSGKLNAESEAQVIMAAYAQGIAVPEIIHICDKHDGLGQAFVMRYIGGETIARKILRDANFATIRPQLAAQCGHALAQLHKLSPPVTLTVSTAAEEVSKYEAILRMHKHPHPVFELALYWLEMHLPSRTPAPCLIHGDFRNGNLIVTPQDGVVAILDWELAHGGDPMEDLGWISVPSWRFGVHDKPIGGFGTRDDFYAAYEMAGGVVRHDDIRFWEVLGMLKWGIMCTMMVDTYESGLDKSVERAAIGRRASETEIDLLLNLIEDNS